MNIFLISTFLAGFPFGGGPAVGPRRIFPSESVASLKVSRKPLFKYPRPRAEWAEEEEEEDEQVKQRSSRACWTSNSSRRARERWTRRSLKDLRGTVFALFQGLTGQNYASGFQTPTLNVSPLPVASPDALRGFASADWAPAPRLCTRPAR